MNGYPAARLVSLDAFRGATIAGMLLANNPGSWGHVYPPLRHAAWHGWTPTDMIFPGFLWIMGVAMTLSWARRVEAGEAPAALFRHVGRRAAIIFGLGLLLAAFPFGWWPSHTLALGSLRIPGVLQRIGLCYAAAGAICLWASGRGQVAWIVGLLGGSAALLKFFPVPGYGAGHIDEAVGNLAWWIDAHVLAGHTWSGAPAPGFDPEGIFSTLAAIATVVLGAWAGRILRAPVAGEVRAARLLGAGVALMGAGLIWDLWLPINKDLWTSSFALFMAGASSVGLAVFYWVIDVRVAALGDAVGGVRRECDRDFRGRGGGRADARLDRVERCGGRKRDAEGVDLHEGVYAVFEPAQRIAGVCGGVCRAVSRRGWADVAQALDCEDLSASAAIN